MKLPDTNVLLNAVNERLPQHSVAVNWLAEAYASPTGLGFAWVALLGFVRLATRQGILEKPLSVDEALRLVHDWLAHPRAQILHPTERHESLLGRLLRKAGTAGISPTTPTWPLSPLSTAQRWSRSTATSSALPVSASSRCASLGARGRIERGADAPGLHHCESMCRPCVALSLGLAGDALRALGRGLVPLLRRAGTDVQRRPRMSRGVCSPALERDTRARPRDDARARRARP